jgi:hypothetical protein
MKQTSTILSGAAALIALGAGLWFSQTTAQAQCTPAGTNDPQNITCTGPASSYFYNAGGGDDTISISGDFSSGSLIEGGIGNDSLSNSGNFSNNSFIRGSDDNDSLSNSGNFSNGSYIQGESGNDSISNSGAFNGSYIQGESGNDSISNSGNFSNISRISGAEDDDSISNSGNFSNSSYISSEGGNDSVSNSGNFSDYSYISNDNGNDSVSNSGAFSNNSYIIGLGDNDTITLLPGSAFDATSWVDGDYLSAFTGNSDLLILYSPVEIIIPANASLPPCQGNADIASMHTNGCFLPWEGGVLYFTNFENIQVILPVILPPILAAQGIILDPGVFGPDAPAGPQVICDDGRVKAFKLPNGDVEYYSGFDVMAPNGFIVTRVSLLDLANGVRTFPAAAQTPNPLGWRVVITQTGNTLSGQVVDADGTPVGNSCGH